MKLIHAKKSLPRRWVGHPAAKGIVFEKDIAITPRARLRLKLLVFSRTQDLRRFWKAGLRRGDLGRGCLGAVSCLGSSVFRFTPKHPDGLEHIEADRRYFAVVGLCLGHLGMEIITHESVHAAFAFAKRSQRTPWEAHAKSFDEESICYPAGRIASLINRALGGADLYTRKAGS